MNKQDISMAKDPDLLGSWTAIQRAALIARDVAIQTNTYLVLMEHGKIVHISAEELLRQRQLSQNGASINKNR